MGAIENCKGETQGTFTLIAHNLVLIACHVIEGQSIQDLNVTFCYTKFKGNFYDAGQTRLERIIEESVFCDYAIVLFSASNLEKIASKYPVKYERFKKKCLGKTGLHELTRQFSVTRVIESDHTIPHNVWNSTINPKMNKIASNGGGKRQGENKMPAITIPYEIHRELLTTGSSKESKVFRQELLDLCNAGRIKRALIKCYQEYEDKGLDLQLYKSQLKNSLDDHVDLGLISNTDKMFIINKFSL